MSTTGRTLRTPTHLQRTVGSIGVFIASLALYLITTCPVSYPGISSRNVVSLLQLSPLETISHPAWTFVQRCAMAASPFGDVRTLHVVSGVFGAISVALLFYLLTWVKHNRTKEERVAVFSPASARWLSGSVAATALALSTPFWFASTRCYAHSFHACLFLTIVTCLASYGARGGLWPLLLSVFLLGLSVIEAGAFLLMAPPMGIVLLTLLWMKGDLDVRRLLLCGLAALAGMSALLLAAWSYSKTPSYEWREFASYLNVVTIACRDVYVAAVHSLPRVGWLTVTLFSLVPWFVIFGISGDKEVQKTSFLSSYALNLVLALCGIAVLANLKVSAWASFESFPLVVLPSVFLASWVGYLGGYWFVFFARQDWHAPIQSHRLRRFAVAVYLTVLGAGTIALGLQSSRIVRNATGLPVSLAAKQVVESMGDREWLVTQGIVDDDIRIAAHEAGQVIKLLNVSMSQHPAYLRYVASLFQEPRLRSLAQVGLGPLLDEWLTSDPCPWSDIAVLHNPDLWHAVGAIPVPNGPIFVAATTTDELSGEDVFRANAVTWTLFLSGMEDTTHQVLPARAYNQWAFRHSGKMANNTGVLLEDMGEPELAYDAYLAARDVDADNLSSMLNLVALAEDLELEEAPELAKNVEEFIQTQKQKLRVWALAYHYGYVRHPMAFVEKGWSWAMTGKPSVAIKDIERAVSLGADESQLRLALASLYFSEGSVEKSEQALLAVLKDDPENKNAILGLARTSSRRGDYDLARSYLARLSDLGMPGHFVQIELAVLEVMAGDTAQAKGLLREVAEKDPENARAAAILALMDVSVGERSDLQNHVKSLSALKHPTPLSLLALTYLHLQTKSVEKARESLKHLLVLRPRHIHAMEMLVKLDLRQGRAEEAERHIRKILAVESGNPLANLVLGSIHYARAEYDLAAAAFRTSVASQPTTEGLNSLAWILYTQGDYEGATKHATSALELNKRNGAAWDTLGMCKMQQGDLEAAEKAIVTAAELQPNRPWILLHLAQLYQRTGSHAKSRKIAEDLYQNRKNLPARLLDEVSRLLSALE